MNDIFEEKKPSEYLDYLEENRLYVHNVLESALTLSDFQDDINKRSSPQQILEQAQLRIRNLIPFEATALLLVDEDDSNFVLTTYQTLQSKKYIENKLDYLIMKGFFGWALRERRGVLIDSEDNKHRFLLHVISTNALIRGMFIGFLDIKTHNIPETFRSLLSIILQNTANALESLELYEKIRDQNVALEEKVEERTNELEQRVIELNRTVSSLNKAEAELQESEEKFRSLVELTSDWIWETDVDGLITYADEKIKNHLGYEKEEVMGKSLIDLVTEEEAKKMSSFFVHSREPLAPFSRLELVHTHKDGRAVVLETSGRPFYDRNGNVIGWRGINSDITARKKAEETLLQARKDAERASIAKSEFLANMSHEIRTPMNGILGMLQILKGTALNSEQHEYLDVIWKSSDALLVLIDDILDISKIEAGKIELETISFNMHLTIEDVVETNAVRAAEKNVEIVSLIDSDVPVILKGDPGRIRQVLNNLIGNAVKFTENGDVTIWVSVEQKEGDDVFLKFKVTDTGIGIPPNRIDAIFDAFAQADGSMTRKFGGTGLGLAISKQLVEMMDGHISAESKIGKGSSFSFTVRCLKDAAAVVTENSIDVDIDLNGKGVLIIDDSIGNQRVCCSMLEALGCRAMAVKSGWEGIKTLREAAEKKCPFELAVVDLMMPGMSGERTAKEIKADPLIRDTKVIIQTSIGNRGDVKRLAQIGIKGYLVKPLKKAQFQKAIVSALGEVDQPPIKPGAIITRHSIRESSFEGLMALLVEDQVVNQKVATKLLQKRGFNVSLAENGEKAVEAMKRSHFDFVLMDIQMPVMDGYEASRQIRKMEKETGRRIPIIAMSANVMKGDREKSLAAGMDDFVPKPIIAEHLFEILGRWVPLKVEESVLLETDHPCSDIPGVSNKKNNVSKQISSSDSFDLNQVLSKFDYDMKFFHELAEIFMTNIPEGMAKLESSLENNDVDEFELQAHNLKGSTGNFGVTGLYELFSELHTLGKEKRMHEAAEVFTKASALYKEVESVLRESLKSIKG